MEPLGTLCSGSMSGDFTGENIFLWKEGSHAMKTSTIPAKVHESSAEFLTKIYMTTPAPPSANNNENKTAGRKHQMSRYPLIRWYSIGRTNPICMALTPEAAEPEGKILKTRIQRPADSNADDSTTFRSERKNIFKCTEK